MHPKVPQRRLKVWLRTLLTMVILFVVTYVVCVAIFLLTAKKPGILSPIFGSLRDMLSPTTAVATVKTLCHEDTIACTNVVLQDPTTIVITLDNGATVYIATQKDLKKQLASLQQVISQLTIKGKQFKTLDFRFDHIIVSF